MIRIAMQGWGQQNLLLFFHAHCMHCWLYVVDGWGFAGGATATKAPRNSQQVMYRRTFDINVLWIVSVLMSPASPILRHLTTTTNRLDWITFFYSADSKCIYRPRKLSAEYVFHKLFLWAALQSATQRGCSGSPLLTQSVRLQYKYNLA